ARQRLVHELDSELLGFLPPLIVRRHDRDSLRLHTAEVPQDQRQYTLPDAAEADEDDSSREIHMDLVFTHDESPSVCQSIEARSASCPLNGCRANASSREDAVTSRRGGVAPMWRIGAFVARQRFDARNPARQCGIVELHRQKARAQLPGLVAIQCAQ